MYDSLVRWCVPVFVMLSGMTFLNPSIDFSYRNLFKKYISRIFVALLFWGMMYNIHADFDKITLYDLPATLSVFVGDFTKLLLWPPWYHLWFLYTIIGLYLITPMLRIFIKNAGEKDIRYVLIIFSIFGPLANLANYFLPSKISFEIPELEFYIGYFIAGYYFATFELSKKIRLCFYVLACSSIVVTFSGTYLLSHASNRPESIFYETMLPTTMIISYAIFVFVKTWSFTNAHSSFLTNRSIVHLSNYCFGVYLIHDFCIQYFVRFTINSDIIRPLIGVPLNSILVFILALMGVYLIKKIPGLKNWIV